MFEELSRLYLTNKQGLLMHKLAYPLMLEILWLRLLSHMFDQRVVRARMLKSEVLEEYLISKPRDTKTPSWSVVLMVLERNCGSQLIWAYMNLLVGFFLS